MKQTRIPVMCAGCGKTLLYKLDTGELEFVFGRSKAGDINTGAPVSMKIVGSVEMQCFRKSCRHWNIIKSNQNIPQEVLV